VTVTTGEHFYPFGPPGCGCIERPAFPAPSFERAERTDKTSRKTCGEIAESYPAVIASAAKQSILSCCTMDCFAALAMTLNERGSLPYLPVQEGEDYP
jgi:hypothetical protein